MMSLEDEEPMSPISLSSIRSESTSPTTIRTAFEEITGESYEDENGMNYRLRTKEGTALGTNVYKVYDSIYKMGQGDRRDAIKDEIAVYEKLSELDETDRKYFLEMKSNKSRGSVVHIELEYLDGVDLVSYLSETNPRPLTLSFIARSIAYALKLLVTLKINHGDIHLANVMIPHDEVNKERPQIKLIDFGKSDSRIFEYNKYYNLDPESEDNYVKLLGKIKGLSNQDIDAVYKIAMKYRDSKNIETAYDEILSYWDGKMRGGKKNIQKEYRMASATRKVEKVRAVGSKRCVFNGTAKHTSGGLHKKDLMLHKGRIISRKKHALGKKAFKNLVNAGYKPKKGTFKLFKKHRGSKA